MFQDAELEGLRDLNPELWTITEEDIQDLTGTTHSPSADTADHLLLTL